jgi:hypothetical protein
MLRAVNSYLWNQIALGLAVLSSNRNNVNRGVITTRNIGRPKKEKRRNTPLEISSSNSNSNSSCGAIELI